MIPDPPEPPDQVRQRLKALMGCAFLNGVGFSGLMGVLPIYATTNLGLSASDFSRVLSLRMAGIVVGAIVLGAISDRLGPKRITLFTLSGAGAGLMLICIVPVWGFLILVPFISAMMSASFVNLNQLTQQVGPGKQGLANTLYRATATGSAIIGPLILTRWIAHLSWLMPVMGLGIFAGAWALSKYPLQERVARVSGIKDELRRVAAVYQEGLTHKRMMAFIVVSLGIVSLSTSVDAFGAVRLTKELSAPAQVYGVTLSISAGLTLVAILGLGTVLDKWPLKASTLILMTVVVASLFGLGLCQSVFWTQVFIIANTVSIGAVMAPLIMWLARVAGAVSLGGALALHKVMTALFVGIAMMLMSLAVPVIGIQWLFLCCAAGCLILLGCLGWLKEPQQA
jgi:MFS transporter, DHA1 family, arabinose polymer utilization protein